MRGNKRDQGNAVAHTPAPPTTKSTIAALPHPRILILSGGGGNGSAQASAVLRLYESGYTPDVILGTSIGAWNGAYLAQNPEVRGAKNLVELWKNGVFGQLALPRPSQLLKALTKPVPSLIGATSIQRVLARTGLAKATWNNLPIPLIVGATDARTGTLQYWDSMNPPETTDSLAPYIAASAGLTPLQPISTVQGRQYIDAGFVDNYGIREALSRIVGVTSEASILIIDAAPAPRSANVQTLGESSVLAEGLLFHQRFDDDIAYAQSLGFEVTVIPVGLNHSVTGFFEPEAGIQVGRDAVDAWGTKSKSMTSWTSPSLLKKLHAYEKVARAAIQKIPRTATSAPHQDVGY